MDNNTLAYPTKNLIAIGIIGGGCAGMSCALWLKQLGYMPVIIEQQAQLGGQLRQLNRLNRWVLGSPNKTSQELAELFADHVSQAGISIQYGSRLAAVQKTRTGFDLTISAPNQASHTITASALVVATGVRARGNEIFSHLPGFPSLCSAGLFSCFPIDHIENLATLRGKTVAVIGGGDNAHYTAKDCALAGARTYLLIRSQPKARPPIRREVEDLIKQGHIIEHIDTQVTALRQQQGGVEITLSNLSNATDHINVAVIFARTGFAANTEFLDNFDAFAGIEKNAGYLITNSVKRTAIPWVYAIGDVTNPKHQSVVNAIADGAIAAQDLSERV